MTRLNFTQNPCFRWKLVRNEYVISSNGTLIEIWNRTNMTHAIGDYELKSDNSCLVCIPPGLEPPFYNIDLIFVALWIISDIFLILAVIIHLILRTKACYSKPFLFHLISLAIFYLMAVLFTTIDCSYFTSDVLSYTLSYMIRVAFCWLTVINYDMWKYLQPENLSQMCYNINHKFWIRFLFAWFFPAIVLSVTYLSGFLDQSDVLYHDNLVETKFQTIILYTSTESVLLVNFILTVLTVRNLYRYGKTIATENRRIYQQLRSLYIKLMLTTGICWIFETLEWALLGSVPPIIWVLADIITALQGLFLFLVYNCNLSTWNQLKLEICNSIWIKNNNENSPAVIIQSAT